MKDKILTMFFDIDRWTKAIEKGVLKDIRKSELIKLTEESTRIRMAEAMLSGKYQITPPHTAQIPKDNGEFRTVYVNEPIDRIILSIANDLLFDLMPEMIHPACKSYQTGIGCGKFVWVDDDNNEELLYEPPTIMVNTDEGPMDVVVYEARLNNGHINLLAYDKEWGNKQHIELEYIATGHLAYLIEYMPVTDKVKSVAINDD